MSEAKTKRGIIALFVAFVAAALLALPSTAWADGVDYAFGGYQADDLTPGKTGAIELDYENADIDGVQTDLYRIADVSTRGFTFTPEFKAYANDIEWLKGEDAQEWLGSNWDVVAETFLAHAQADGLAPLKSGNTVRGAVTFADLPAGLYLAKTHNVTVGSNTYVFSPSIQALPVPGEAGQAASWNVKAEPKVAVKPVAPHKMKLVKHWVVQDGSNAVASVESISVQLLRDGIPWGDPVQLSERNNWTYTWEDTEGTHEWSASEQAINGSSVVWSRQVALSGDDVIVMTNTEVSDVPPTPPGSGLPKTGQSWWHIPVLLLLALASFGVARFVSTRERS